MMLTTLEAREFIRCRAAVAVCVIGLFGLLFLLSFPAGQVFYALGQFSAFGIIIWAGRLLKWGAFRVLLYIVLAFVPLVNWIALGDIHRALGKKLRMDGHTKSSQTGDSRAMIGVVVVLLVGGLVIAFSDTQERIAATEDASQAIVPVNHPESYKPNTTSSIDAELSAILNKSIAEQRQGIFEALHPTGTATGSKIHEVKITKWRNGIASNQAGDIAEFVVRYTIYWKGPVNRDGFTKISQTFDAEVNRYIRSEVLETNGITNNEAAEAAGFIIGVALRHAIESDDSH
jgi:hypothetical protein